jgi:diguanylate cyclase (GGDEF)-like protein
MNKVFRKLYLPIAPILIIPLLATAITGILYGVGNQLGLLPKTLSNILINIHQGEFLGKKLMPFYVLFMSLGIFTIGLITLIKSRNNLIFRATKPNTISICKLLALILVIPLAICVETGVAYRLGTDWLNMPSQQTAILLSIHTGAPLGVILGIFYILITGFGLILLSIMGIKMTTSSKTALPSNQLQQSSVRQTSQYSLPLLDNSFLLKQKIRNAILVFSVIFFAILGFASSAILFSLFIVAIVFTLPAWLIAEKLIVEKLIQDWQNQKKIQAKLYDKEAETATILRAIPDSMLRMTKEGVCLSYIPAKEASSFVIKEEIINKNVTNFLDPKIAHQFIKSAQLSLKSGLTHFYRFPIPLDNGGRKYHEARITAIGATEVLIMIRELDGFEEALVQSSQISSLAHQDSLRLLNESEFVELIESTLENDLETEESHVLGCLIIDNLEALCYDFEANSTSNYDSRGSELLIEKVAETIKSCLQSGDICHLDSNELIILLPNCSLEEVSESVIELRHILNNISFQWEGEEYPIKVSIGLIEINANDLDVTDLIDAAKTACYMAKQKVDIKTFW